MAKRNELSLEKRMEAVMALLRREEPASKLTRRYGISEPTLYRYRDLFLEGGKIQLASNQRQKSDPRDQTINRLEKKLRYSKRVIGELTIANDILKKHQNEPH